MSDNSFIDIDVESATEPEIVTAGDYSVEVVLAEVSTSKKGNEQLHMVLRILNSGSDNPRVIHHYLALPKESDTVQIQNSRKLDFKRIYDAFDVPRSGTRVDVSDLVGLIAQATLVVESSEDYGDSNRVKRFMKSA